MKKIKCESVVNYKTIQIKFQTKIQGGIQCKIQDKNQTKIERVKYL